MNFSVYEAGKKVNSAHLPIGAGVEDTAVFESLRTYGAAIFREEEHLDRLTESARTAGISMRYSRADLRRELRLAAGAFRRESGLPASEDLFFRLTLDPNKLYVLAGIRRHAPEIYEKGVVLRTTSVRRPLVNASAPQAKTGAYQTALLAAVEPGAGAYESLFLDVDGYVAEVSIGNLFIVKGGLLKTPPAQGILNGVTRRFVIECVLPGRLRLEETYFTRHDVFNADEVFLTNTSWEILPVREVDGRAAGARIPGPWTLKIHRLFKAKVAEECRKLKSSAPSSASRTKRD